MNKAGIFTAVVICGALLSGVRSWSQDPAEGRKLYASYCASCHGDKGKGDGLAGMTLKPRPANFKKDALQAQSDGAIFWKITEGRAPMAAYKGALTEEQRWQLVNYIRQLGSK